MFYLSSITYEDFLRCFEFVTVVNLLVDKPDQNLKDVGAYFKSESLK